MIDTDCFLLFDKDTMAIIHWDGYLPTELPDNLLVLPARDELISYGEASWRYINEYDIIPPRKNGIRASELREMGLYEDFRSKYDAYAIDNLEAWFNSHGVEF